MAEETVDHIFNAHAGLDVLPCEPSLLPCTSSGLCEPRSYCSRLFAGAKAWIEEQAIPDVSVESTGFHGKPGSSGVCRADSLGWNLPRILVYVLASSTGIRISQSSLRRGYRDNGESWSGQAQALICLTLLGDAQ
jgi:hypothetical protein